MYEKERGNEKRTTKMCISFRRIRCAACERIRYTNEAILLFFARLILSIRAILSIIFGGIVFVLLRLTRSRLVIAQRLGNPIGSLLFRNE